MAKSKSEFETVLQQIQTDLQQLRQLYAAEYARGEKDAIGRIVQAAHGEPQRNGHDTKESRPQKGPKGRAPSGSAGALVDRVLGERGQKGATSSEIHGAAKTPVEKMVSYSGVRFVLAQGREKGRYRNKGGKWFLRAENKAAESGAHP